MVVTIDGPAGAGKTTVGRGVARALGLGHLDTGAMYRALTAKALAEGISPADGPGLARLARRTAMGFDGGIVIDGRRAGREIRALRVNRAVSAVSAHPEVRRELVRRQRAIMRRGGIVAEGRDLGTVVAPHAPVKVFLTASIDERARRRHRELTTDRVSLRTLRREIARRDALDSTRKASPLRPARGALVLDSTKMTPREVVAEIVAMARAVEERRRR